jgi:hypothetical protein
MPTRAVQADADAPQHLPHHHPLFHRPRGGAARGGGGVHGGRTALGSPCGGYGVDKLLSARGHSSIALISSMHVCTKTPVFHSRYGKFWPLLACFRSPSSCTYDPGPPNTMEGDKLYSKTNNVLHLHSRKRKPATSSGSYSPSRRSKHIL